MVILVNEEAQLIEIFINIGLVSDSGSSFFLPRTVGFNKAFELCCMRNRLKVCEAVSIGLINKAVPAGELDVTVKGYTDFYAMAPTKSIGLIKKMLNKAQTALLDEMLDYEAYCKEIASSSQDYKERAQAFLEKRKPNFSVK